MRFTHSQTNFTSGRLSPKLANRVDTKQYANGASTLTGMKVIAEGGVERVKGTLPLIINGVVETYPKRHAEYNAVSGEYEWKAVTQSRLISVLVRGVHFVHILSRTETNGIYVETYRTSEENPTVLNTSYPPSYFAPADYPADYEFVPTTRIIEGGSTVYDLNDLTYAQSKDTTYFAHSSGTMCPFKVSILKYFKLVGGVYVPEAFPTYYETEAWSIKPRVGIAESGIDVTAYPDSSNDSQIYTYFGQKNPIIYPMTAPIGAYSGIAWHNQPTGQLKVSLPSEITNDIMPGEIIYLEGVAMYNNGSDNMFTAWSEFHLYVKEDGGKSVVQTLNFDGTNYFHPVTALTDVRVDAASRSIWRSGNYPKIVAGHESRIVYGNCNTHPLSFFGSATSNAEFYCQQKRQESGNVWVKWGSWNIGPTLPTDPYWFTASGDRDAQITVLKSASDLMLGTDRKERVVDGGDTIISALSIKMKPQSSQGADMGSAISSGAGVFYTSRRGRELYCFKYSDANGSMVSTNVGLLFGDILERTKIKKLVWAGNVGSLMVLLQDGRILAIRSTETGELSPWDTGLSEVLDMEGTEFCLYISRKNKGWQVFEPTFNMELTYEFVEEGTASYTLANNTWIHSENQLHIITAPNTDISLGLVGIRYSGIDGSMTYTYVDPGNTEPYLFVPYSVINNADPATGLERWPVSIRLWNKRTGDFRDIELEDTALIDVGGQLPNFTSTDFRRFLKIESDILDTDDDGAWAEYVVGQRGEDAQVSTMNIEAGQQWGTAQMGIKNIDTVGVRFYKTYSYQISATEKTWQTRIVADKLGYAGTGRDDVKFDSSPKEDMKVHIRSAPYEPLTILGLNFRGVSNDG